jgi:hypothetical protein
MWDEGWRSHRKNDWLSELRNFDCIVVWQRFAALKEVAESIDPGIPIIFVPMYDDYVPTSAELECDPLSRTKVICFSVTLFNELALRDSRRVKLYRFFPNPNDLPTVTDYTTPRGYFWMRTGTINEGILRSLCSNLHFARFEVHNVPDPGSSSISVPAISADETRITNWYDSHAQYCQNLATSNLYFAPRYNEGIGMSFLEAMAMGLCVVAPNTPTHNEYISDGETGLLYDINNPHPIDIADLKRIGQNAREMVRQGFNSWRQETVDLQTFLRNVLQDQTNGSLESEQVSE